MSSPPSSDRPPSDAVGREPHVACGPNAERWRIADNPQVAQTASLRAATLAHRERRRARGRGVPGLCRIGSRPGRPRSIPSRPFRAFQANAAWLELVLVGQDLLVWTQRLLLADGELARCEPKRLRYRLLHVAGPLTRHARRLVLHLPRALAVAGRTPAGLRALTRAASGVALKTARTRGSASASLRRADPTVEVAPQRTGTSRLPLLTSVGHRPHPKVAQAHRSDSS